MFRRSPLGPVGTPPHLLGWRGACFSSMPPTLPAGIHFSVRRDDSCDASQHRSVAFQAAMPPFVGAFFLRAAALFPLACQREDWHHTVLVRTRKLAPTGASSPVRTPGPRGAPHVPSVPARAVAAVV